MKKKATKAELESSILEMKETIENPDVPEEFKAGIKKSLEKAEKLLSDMEKATTAQKETSTPAEQKKHKSKHEAMAEEAHGLVRDLSAKIKEFNAHRSKLDLVRDDKRHAKPPGKRRSEEGNIYYEYRPNRSDINQNGKPYLKEGGVIDKDAYKSDTIASGVKIAVIANEHDIKASDLTFQEFARKVFDVTNVAYPVYKLRFAYEVLKKNHLCCGGNIEMAAHKEYERGGVMVAEKDHWQYRLGGKLPEYWGKGRNINVFGFETKAFDISSIAADEFEHAVKVIEKEHSENEQDEYTKRCKSYLRDLAEQVDNLFRLEKIYYTHEGPDDKSWPVIVTVLAAIGRYDYKSGSHVNLGFLGEHLYNIAKAQQPATMEDGGEIADMPEAAFSEKAKFQIDDVVIYVGKKHKVIDEPIKAWPGEYRYDLEPVEEVTEPVEGAPAPEPVEVIDYPVREELLEAVPVEVPAGPTPEEVEAMKKGGVIKKKMTTFSEKVSAIEAKLNGTKVPAKYRKEYGKKYTPKTANEAATKIAGSIAAHEKMEGGGHVKHKVLGKTKTGKDVFVAEDIVVYKDMNHPKEPHKKLIRALPDYTKADHLDAANLHEKRADEYDKKWGKVIREAHQETYGEPWHLSYYHVSGIGDSSYSEEKKDKLREVSDYAQRAKDAMHLHRDAAKIVNRMKYR